MIEINLFDTGFVGQACSVALQTPRTMRYVRNQMEWPGVTVFTNGQMFDPIVGDVRSRYKVGWVNGDARCLRPHYYERVEDVASKFDAIMTHDAQLLARGAPFIRTIRGGSWVQLEDWCLPPKTKNVSMILSEKTALPGHQLRHAIAGAGLAIDLFGPQHTPIGHNKSSAYREYRFAVVVEACQEENWFTEHLIDALAFGCIPIYWGCPNVSDFFPRTFRRFSTLDAIAEGLTGWTAAGYDCVRSIVAELQESARTYAITEDWQIANCLRPFVGQL
jgi:hypothetical protein